MYAFKLFLAVLCVAPMTVTTATTSSSSSSSVSSQCPTCVGPQFSWDRVPVFFHGSRSDTGLDGSFSDATTQWLVDRFPVITIEKWQGSKAPKFIYEEEAWVAAAKKIKALNPATSVVVWTDSVRVYTSNHTLNPFAKSSCGTGNFRPADYVYTNADEFLLHEADGTLAHDAWSGCGIWDFSRQPAQAYWKQMCLNMTSSGVIDGCGADAAWMTSPPDTAVAPDVAAAWNVGHQKTLNETSEALGEGLILGKEADEVGVYVSGALCESCPNSNATVNLLRNLTARSRAMGGKRLMYECHMKTPAPRSPASGTKGLYNVAAFLIGAGENHYIGLGGWTQTGSDFSDHYLPDLFGPALGAPQSDAVYDASTKTWTRKFGSGSNVTTVTFNAGDNTGTISFANGKTFS